MLVKLLADTGDKSIRKCPQLFTRLMSEWNAYPTLEFLWSDNDVPEKGVTKTGGESCKAGNWAHFDVAEEN